MQNIIGTPQFDRKTSNRIKNYPVEAKNNQEDSEKLIMLTAATTISTMINKSVFTVSDLIAKTVETSTKLMLPEYKVQKLEEPFRTTTTISENFSDLTSEGEIEMTEEVRQRDLDSLKENTDLKLDKIDEKISALISSIDRIEKMIEEKPTTAEIDLKIEKLKTKISGWGWTVLLGIPTLVVLFNMIIEHFSN